MKKKIKKEYLRRTRKLLEAKLYSRNNTKGMNTWAVLLVRYSGPFLKLNREELKQIDRRTAKLMTMHKALHPRHDIDWLYSSRKKGGKGLTSIKKERWRIDTTTRRLHRKAWRKTDYSHQKQYWQHEDPQNGNNQKTKMGRKTTRWGF